MGNVPNLRFPGFEGEWEETKLGKIADIYDGTHQTPKYVNNGVKFVSVENINNLDSTNKFITTEDFETEYKIKPRTGDILMTRITAGIIGATAIVQNDDPLAYYVSLALIRIKDRTNVQFLAQRIETDKFKHELHKRIIHVAFPKKINLGDIQDCIVSIPSLLEQNKIASFLSLIDKRIQAQIKIIQCLETSMQGLREKLFKRKIKFKDESGKDFPNWEVKPLGKILTIGNGKDYKHLGRGDIPVFGTGGLMTYVDSFLYNGETICIGRKGTIDKPMYYQGKIWTVDTLFYTHSFLYCVPKFIFYIFQSINWIEYNEASGVPSLSKSTIEKIPLLIPSLAEQTPIANFLSFVDEKIEAEKKILEQYKNQKKYLLRNMFV